MKKRMCCLLAVLVMSPSALRAAEAPALAPHPAHILTLQALAYEHGEGVMRDQPRAAGLYCEAARQGDPDAMHALGWMYANGRGIERNDAYAGTLFAMAAMLGNVHAERMLRHTGEYTGALPACMHVPPETFPESTSVEGLISAVPAVRQEIARLLVRLAPQYGITPRFALAIGLTESRLDPAAVSPKSAMGVMQLIPETAERFNVRNPHDPEQNIRGGLAYLRLLLAYFKGDVALTAAAYNAGEGAVDRHRGVPPYRETRGYVQRILALVNHPRHPYDDKVVAPSAVLSGMRLTESSGQGS